MAAARNDLVSNAWKRGLVGYRILVEHLDLYYKSPMLSKFLRSVVETVDILEYNWIKRFFKFPNRISLRYKYEIRRGEVVTCPQIAVYRSGAIPFNIHTPPIDDISYFMTPQKQFL